MKVNKLQGIYHELRKQEQVFEKQLRDYFEEKNTKVIEIIIDPSDVSGYYFGITLNQHINVSDKELNQRFGVMREEGWKTDDGYYFMSLVPTTIKVNCV